MCAINSASLELNAIRMANEKLLHVEVLFNNLNSLAAHCFNWSMRLSFNNILETFDIVV